MQLLAPLAPRLQDTSKLQAVIGSLLKSVISTLLPTAAMGSMPALAARTDAECVREAASALTAPFEADPDRLRALLAAPMPPGEARPVPYLPWREAWRHIPAKQRIAAAAVQGDAPGLAGAQCCSLQPGSAAGRQLCRSRRCSQRCSRVRTTAAGVKAQLHHCLPDLLWCSSITHPNEHARIDHDNLQDVFCSFCKTQTAPR